MDIKIIMNHNPLKKTLSILRSQLGNLAPDLCIFAVQLKRLHSIFFTAAVWNV